MKLINNAFNTDGYTKSKTQTILLDQYLRDGVWYAVWQMDGREVLFKLNKEDQWVRVKPGGFTLLEVLAALVIFGILIQAVSMVGVRIASDIKRADAALAKLNTAIASCNACRQALPSSTPVPSPTPTCPAGHHEGDQDEDSQGNHH